MFRKRSIIKLISLVMLVFLAIPVFASTIIDFEDATAGASVNTLSYTGVSFSSTNWFVLGSGPLPTKHILGPCGATLTISFDSVQRNVRFIWASIDNTLNVDLFLAGSLVGNAQFAGPFGSLASVSGTFDELEIGGGTEGGCAAIDNLSFASSNTADSSIPVFTDGRINNYDGGSPVVLYPHDYGDGQMGLDIYAADESGLLLSINAAQIASVAECPESNTVIAYDATTGITLSRLTVRPDGVCPFQLNAPTAEAGKYYIIIFYALSSPSYYESYEAFIGN